MITMRVPDQEEMDHHKRFYEEDGFCRIKNVFTKESMDLLRVEALHGLITVDEAQVQWRKRFPALLFWPPNLNDWSHAIAPVVRSFLGDNVLQLNKQYYFRMPGDGDQFAWHQDICFRIPKESFDQIETGYLQTAIVVDRMGSQNGGIEFALGSHKQPDLGLVPRDNTERGLRNYVETAFDNVMVAEAEPGDLLLWSVMIVHGSKPNTSIYPRAYFMNGFAKAQCVKGLGFPFYLKDGNLV